MEVTPDLLEVSDLAFISEGGAAPDDEGAMDAREIGGEIFGDPVGEILLLGITTDIDEGQNDDRKVRRLALFVRGRGRARRDAPFQGMDPHRPSDVLEHLLAQIDEWLLQPVADLPIRVLRKANSARLADALQSRGDIHTIAYGV